MRHVIAAAPLTGTRATDLGRTFDLDGALAWQIHALANQPELLMTARVVPKAGAMERFLRAAERIAPGDLARSVRAAYDAFQRVVDDHAGDRDTFDAMLTLQRPEDAAGLRRVRRTAHRANAAVWGVSCRCGIRTMVLRQRPTGEQDSLFISGRIGLQRLYADALVSISASSRTWGGSSLRPDADTAITVAPCELIEPACSRPLPRVSRIAGADGAARDYLTIDGIGKRSEATFFWRNTALGVPGDLSTPPHLLSTTSVVPTELLLMYLLIPRGWVKDPTVRAWVTPDTTHFSIPDPAGQYRLPFEGEGEHLGTSLSALYAPAVPQYAGLVRSELERLGWAGTEFDIFRCEVQHPVLHSTVHLCVE